MRQHAAPSPLPAASGGDRHDWQTIRTLLPYLWAYKWRVMFAMASLVAAKFANVGVPLIFKDIIDALTPAAGSQAAIVLIPLGLLGAYGALRFSTSLFTELRELLFTRVTQRAVRTITLQVFRHLHSLSLRFHLERQTGGLTRDIERGTRSIGSLISWTLYSIFPTVVEITLVLGLLATRYEWSFAAITLGTLVVYIWFTIVITNWRTHLRRKVNELDSAANTRAIDALLNYETVKYFNNEEYEARRYDEQLQHWEQAQVKSQITLSYLNLGQAFIIAIGVTAMMWRASVGVAEGHMTLGDIVLVNTLMIQLYLPLNFLGMLYREIRQALTDIERMFSLLHAQREVSDSPNAASLDSIAQHTPLDVSFDHVTFGYELDRTILHDLSLHIPAGKTVAVVGHSGGGKSTLARLLYRFYDVPENAGNGGIRIGAHDIRQIKQDSLRRAIGIVPQDTVLFNDSIRYNIRYGRPDASDAEVENAARAAQLHDFINQLPKGYDTPVGERGLKLSGGEKQRVAIARALLKNPPILIFDEATSALDTRTEQAIQEQLEQAARGRTTLVIAHRLSTVMNADQIVVIEGGRVIERGTHTELLNLNGHYAQMWAMQQQEEQT